MCTLSIKLSSCPFLWLGISPFHLFKNLLSINSGEIWFSQGSGGPRRINKSSQSFHPPTDRRTNTFGGLHSELMSARRECSLYLSSILFCLFSQSIDLPVTNTPCTWGHWLSWRSHVWSSVTRLGWSKPVSFSRSRKIFFFTSHFCCVLVKNECWMESKNGIRSSWLPQQNKAPAAFPLLALKGTCSCWWASIFFPMFVPTFDSFKTSKPFNGNAV